MKIKENRNLPDTLSSRSAGHSRSETRDDTAQEERHGHTITRAANRVLVVEYAQRQGGDIEQVDLHFEEVSQLQQIRLLHPKIRKQHQRPLNNASQRTSPGRSVLSTRNLYSSSEPPLRHSANVFSSEETVCSNE